MKTAILFFTIFLAAGCAGTRIKPVEFGGTAHVADLYGALLAYNRADGAFKVLGEVRHPGGVRIGFGARVIAGRAVRMDGVASPSARVLFSAGCPPESGCDLYFPDDFVVYRENRAMLGGWFSLLVAGRVPLVGEPIGAGVDGSGSPVLHLADASGQWSTIVFTRDGRLPVRVLYGDADLKPRLELVYSDFRNDGGVEYPGELLVGGEKKGDEFFLRFDRMEEADGVPGEVFGLRLPTGVRVVETNGSTAWKKLGMYWTPKH